MEDKKKVFFITSNQTKIDKFIEYEIPKNVGITNLKAGNINAEYREEKKYRNSLFSFFINSFEIEQNDLKNKNKDPRTNKYKAKISWRYNRVYFPGDTINFIPSKNNFIFDFKFHEYLAWYKVYEPPPQVNLSLIEQFKFYINYLKKVLKAKSNEQIYKDLISDSQRLCFGKKFYLDYFLEIFKNCYAQKEVIFLLQMFKLNNIILPMDFEYNDYKILLNVIEKSPNTILSKFSEKENKNIYYEYFYTLLLFVRYNYDYKKAIEMLGNKNIWDHLIIILPNNSKYFPDLYIPNELINKMFEQNLKFEIIEGILNFSDSIEKILVLINQKIECIANCCMNENKKIELSKFKKQKKNDNLENIIDEIKKIIIYEEDNEKFFITFNQEFWEKYYIFDDDSKNLFMINIATIISSAINNNLIQDEPSKEDKIHNFGLNALNEGTLKNEELLYFIKIDIYFCDNKYANINYRPFEIINGLDFDEMTDKFFAKWNTLNIFNIYSFAGFEFKSLIIDKITEMKNFGKLLKLFDYKDRNIFNGQLKQKLCNKFKNLMSAFNYEGYPKFVEGITYFIYIIDFQKSFDI